MFDSINDHVKDCFFSSEDSVLPITVEGIYDMYMISGSQAKRGILDKGEYVWTTPSNEPMDNNEDYYSSPEYAAFTETITQELKDIDSALEEVKASNKTRRQ